MKHLFVDEAINSCHDCVYCEHNTDYGRTYDSGYDCLHPKLKTSKRIIDDYDYSKFKLDKATLPIPDWCPLPDLSKIFWSDESNIIGENEV